MKKILLALGWLCCVGLHGAIALSFEENIRVFCEQKWPDEYSMQEYCIDKEHDGLASSLSFIERNRNHSVSNRIYKFCSDKWTDNNIIEWSMVAYCLDTEASSFNRLHPDNKISP